MKLFRHHAVFYVRRADPVPAIEPRGDVTFEQVTRENLGDVLSFRAEEYAVVFERQLQKGQLGVYAYRDRRVVAHGWMNINRESKPIRANGYFHLLPREGLVHFCSVAEPHRGLGIYQALLCDLYRRAFAREPVDLIFIDTVVNNAPSRKAISKTATFLTNANYMNLGARAVKLAWPLDSSQRFHQVRTSSKQ
jgi:hypothetical protein